MMHVYRHRRLDQQALKLLHHPLKSKLLSCHFPTTGFFSLQCPIVKERRRFIDVMEEEADARRQARLEVWGQQTTKVLASADAYVDQEMEVTCDLRLLTHHALIYFNMLQLTVEREVIDGLPPFFREKPIDVALCEGEPLELSCLVTGDPKPAVHWLKNDFLFMDDSRSVRKREDDNALASTAAAFCCQNGCRGAIGSKISLSWGHLAWPGLALGGR